jgi:ATP-binding cassette subfamily B protein
MGIIVKFAKRHFKEQQENLGSLNGKVEETFTGCEIVNLFNMQKKEDSFFDAYNQKLTKSNKKSSFFGGLFMGVFSLTSNIGYAIVVLVVALLALYGGTN